MTTVRDQGSAIAPLVGWGESIAAGAFDGPRVGYGAIQYYSDWAWDDEQGQGVEPEADPDHVERAVALGAIFGAQHLKTRTFRRWDIDAHFVAEAHRRGLRVTGHCVYPLPLVAAGIDSKEHLGFCTRGEDHIYDDFVQLYRAAGIAVVPTISYLTLAVRMDRPDVFDGDPELAPFLPPSGNFDWMVNLPPETRRGFARLAGDWHEAVAKLARAGVTLGVGTDIWQLPDAVHVELEELVSSGLSPLQASRAATGDAARILGAEQDLGTVETGARRSRDPRRRSPGRHPQHAPIFGVMQDGRPWIVPRSARATATSRRGSVTATRVLALRTRGPGRHPFCTKSSPGSGATPSFEEQRKHSPGSRIRSAMTSATHPLRPRAVSAALRVPARPSSRRAGAERATPVFVDGQAQVVPAFGRSSGSATTCGRDGVRLGPGRRARSRHVDVTRPAQTEAKAEGAGRLRDEPYYPAPATTEQFMWNPRQQLGEPPSLRDNSPPIPYQKQRSIISDSHVADWVPRGFAVVH